MSNYYEILQIRPDAPAPEIEAACDTQYNYWRRLITHHDPNMVNQANQTLQLLETIRATLTHPERRIVYDAQLQGEHGMNDKIGNTKMAAHPGVMPPSPSLASSLRRVDVWLCHKCQTANVPGNTYCKQCGHTIGVHCPNCSMIVEASVAFCSHCGVNVVVAARQKELESMLSAKQRVLATTEYSIPDRDAELKILRHETISAAAWLILISGSLAFYSLLYLDLGFVSQWDQIRLLIFGIRVIALVGLALFLRAFSLSALLAGLFFLGDFMTGDIFLFAFFMETPIFGFVIFGIYGLALWNIGSRLHAYCNEAYFWVGWALLLKGVRLSFCLDLISLFGIQYLGGGDPAMRLELMLDFTQVIVLSILTLRAWWLGSHLAHEIAATRLMQRLQVEQLQSEIRQITYELQSLGKK